MPYKSLYEIDAEELFTNHHIEEIEEIRKEIQTEIEKKREELRTMVGERYRDLLSAADTIIGMRETATSLITELQEVTSCFKDLNEKQLIGFQTIKDGQATLKNENHLHYCTVFQIHLLTCLPEIIWTRIDEEKYFVATQLFILSRHIITGLQLNAENNDIEKFPVAQKQWEVLKPFHATIKQYALSALEKDTLAPDAATDCLLTLLLLEQSSVEHVLSTFLKIRAKAYLATLSSDKSAQLRVKDRILSSLEALNATVSLVYKCFVDCGNGRGFVVDELEKLASPDTTPTVTLMELDESDMYYELPEIIAKFKPNFQMPSITPAMLRSVKDTWLQTISKIVENQLKSLFDLVSSMKTIQEIKHQASKLEKDTSWPEICEKLSLPANVDFYQHYYRPLINNRVREIVRQTWAKTVSATYEEVKEFLRNSATSKVAESDSRNLWKEHVDDIPVSLKQALQQDKKNNRLLMKSRGFNSEVVNICETFDHRLKSIFSEVNVLLDEENAGLAEEKQAMVDFLKDTSEACLSELITKVKGLEFAKKKEHYIILARLLTALTHLCPHLKMCLSHTYMASNWDRISSDRRNYEKWNRVCALFEDEAFALWKEFCVLFFEQMSPEEMLSKTIGIDIVLNDFTVWEVISIEEKDEQDNAIQSSIQVPSQPRISLQIYFFKFIATLNDSLPETLPRKVLHYLNSLLSKQILALYAKYAESDFVTGNQNAALQLYFDLKFFQIIFVARDDRDVQDELQRLTNVLKSFVDPFDFELFHPYLIGNVKKCAHRLQHELGVIIPYPENLALLMDQKPTVTTQERDPNILCLSSNGVLSTWFPLLPVVTPGTRVGVFQTDGDKSSAAKSKKQTDPKLSTSMSSSSLASAQQTAQNYASNVKSGAAAFFGAMSQEWFR